MFLVLVVRQQVLNASLPSAAHQALKTVHKQFTFSSYHRPLLSKHMAASRLSASINYFCEMHFFTVRFLTNTTYLSEPVVPPP